MSDARAPQTTRESRSRPSSSVPSQKAAEGGLRTARKLVFVGSARPRWGAAIAASAKTRTRAPPQDGAPVAQELGEDARALGGQRLRVVDRQDRGHGFRLLRANAG